MPSKPRARLCFVHNPPDQPTYHGEPQNEFQLLELSKPQIQQMWDKFDDLPLMFTHMHNRKQIGKVVKKGWEDGSPFLEVEFDTDSEAAKVHMESIRRGVVTECSLSHDPSDMTPIEVSLCVGGRRPNTHIIAVTDSLLPDGNSNPAFRPARLPVEAALQGSNNEAKEYTPDNSAQDDRVSSLCYLVLLEGDNNNPVEAALMSAPAATASAAADNKSEPLQPKANAVNAETKATESKSAASHKEVPVEAPKGKAEATGPSPGATASAFQEAPVFNFNFGYQPPASQAAAPMEVDGPARGASATPAPSASTNAAMQSLNVQDAMRMKNFGADAFQQVQLPTSNAARPTFQPAQRSPEGGSASAASGSAGPDKAAADAGGAAAMETDGGGEDEPDKKHVFQQLDSDLSPELSTIVKKIVEQRGQLDQGTRAALIEQLLNDKAAQSKKSQEISTAHMDIVEGVSKMLGYQIDDAKRRHIENLLRGSKDTNAAAREIVEVVSAAIASGATAPPAAASVDGKKPAPGMFSKIWQNLSQRNRQSTAAAAGQDVMHASTGGGASSSSNNTKVDAAQGSGPPGQSRIEAALFMPPEKHEEKNRILNGFLNRGRFEDLYSSGEAFDALQKWNTARKAGTIDAAMGGSTSMVNGRIDPEAGLRRAHEQRKAAMARKELRWIEASMEHIDGNPKPLCMTDRAVALFNQTMTQYLGAGSQQRKDRIRLVDKEPTREELEAHRIRYRQLL